MKIVVLVKEVPDTWGPRLLDLQTGIADRAASEAVLDEISERALEVALAYADTNPGTEIEALTMAPDSATATLRKALAMGATSATHVSDPGLGGADLSLTAEVLAAALRRSGFDLVIAGNLSTDGVGGVLPAMIAERLDVPSATYLNSVSIDAHSVSGERASDGAVLSVSAELPAVISITEQLPDARFPSFKGVMAAKKKPIATLTLTDLGIDPDDQTVARSIVIGIAERPPRQAGVKLVDDGDAGSKLADYLVLNQLA